MNRNPTIMEFIKQKKMEFFCIKRQFFLPNLLNTYTFSSYLNTWYFSRPKNPANRFADISNKWWASIIKIQAIITFLKMAWIVQMYILAIKCVEQGFIFQWPSKIFMKRLVLHSDRHETAKARQLPLSFCLFFFFM